MAVTDDDFEMIGVSKRQRFLEYDGGSQECNLQGQMVSSPTREMIVFYERRTKAHIQKVGRCLSLFSSVADFPDELNYRARIHDASKFESEERDPYIWLTEFHRCQREGRKFSYPKGMKERVSRAVYRHTTTNRHHPEFHADPNDMTDVDLVEMVCDWTAMSQEFGQDGGSALGWANKTIGVKLYLNDERREFVYSTISRLDDLLRKEAS